METYATFLELCHKSLKNINTDEPLAALAVSPVEQAQSAKQAAIDFLRGVRSSGRLGNRLHAFVLTLGQVFAVSHRRPTQSEPEISHFSIDGSVAALTQEQQDLLNEAVKWSVLYEAAETKAKSEFQPLATDWVLAPIYAPYFHITYRKRRKIEFSPADFAILADGPEASRRMLLQSLVKKWEIDKSELGRSLFSEIEEKEEGGE